MTNQLTNSREANGYLLQLAAFQFSPRSFGSSEQKADLALVEAVQAAMRKKLEQKRGEGRGGWWEPDSSIDEDLKQMLIEHIDRGDWLDAVNISAMLFARHEIRTINEILCPPADTIEQYRQGVDCEHGYLKDCPICSPADDREG